MSTSSAPPPKSKSVEEAIRDFARQEVSDGIARYSYVRVNGVLCELHLVPRPEYPFVSDTAMTIYERGAESASRKMAEGLSLAAARREGFAEAYERLLEEIGEA